MFRLFLQTLALGLTLADPAQAETPLSAAEFDAYSRDLTLYYATDGQSYGAEQYLPDRRVRWSFLDGNCKEGQWYESSGLICFVYEDNPDPQCWSFYRRPNGLMARFENDPGKTELYEVKQSDEPMLCLGPEVGV